MLLNFCFSPVNLPFIKGGSQPRGKISFPPHTGKRCGGLGHVVVVQIGVTVRYCLHFKCRASHLLMNDCRCEQKGTIKDSPKFWPAQLEGWSWH